MFSTGQSVRPEGGRRWTALSGPVPSFPKLARRPDATDYSTPAVPREKCFITAQEPTPNSKQSLAGLLTSSHIPQHPESLAIWRLQDGYAITVCVSHRRVLTHETHSFIRSTTKAEQKMNVK